MIVLGAGTGGSITGLARKLKEKVPNVKVKRIQVKSLFALSLYKRKLINLLL